MKFRMGSPNFHISPVTSKNRAERLMVDAIKNSEKLISNAPADMVKILKGIGVNPAVKITQKFHALYCS